MPCWIRGIGLLWRRFLPSGDFSLIRGGVQYEGGGGGDSR